jgi:transcriptional regulator with XRE-family HTH domain
MGDAPPMPDLEPITVTLRRLTAAAGLTYRALAQRTRELDQRGRGVTHSYIAGLASGKEQPSPRSLELIAHALDVAPEVFGEYRLATLRRQLDPKRSGFDAARKRYLELVR